MTIYYIRLINFEVVLLLDGDNERMFLTVDPYKIMNIGLFSYTSFYLITHYCTHEIVSFGLERNSYIASKFDVHWRIILHEFGDFLKQNPI